MNRYKKTSVVLHCARRRPRRVAALTLALALGLAGCGQKGPLTLPEAPASAASAPAGSSR